MDAKLKSRIDDIVKEFPLYAAFLKSVEDGKTVVKDDTYYSSDFDGGRICYEYARIEANKIVTLGEERGRDGGDYWVKSHDT